MGSVRRRFRLAFYWLWWGPRRYAWEKDWALERRRQEETIAKLRGLVTAYKANPDPALKSEIEALVRQA